MPNFNFLVFLNAYSDQNPSNAPSLSNFRWDREIQGFSVSNPESLAFSLAPGETKTLINGVRTLLQDSTTQYSLALKPLTSNTYILSAVAGTLPNFRTPRANGSDATTKVTVTLNGPLATFTAPSSSAVAASFVGQVAGMATNVTIAAVTAGAAGNSILLTGDGTSTINQLIVGWNTGHGSNQAVLQAGDDTQVPNLAAVIQLSGGVDAVTGFNLSAVQVGDAVRVGDLFNQSNQGEWKIVAKSATSFTVENEFASAEGPIVLGSGFASQIAIYSAAGVQIGDTLVISAGFSLVTQGSYKVTSVGANFLEFYSTDALPQEGPIMTQGIALYSAAKRLVYLESDQKCSITLNGVSAPAIEPLIMNNSVQPGIFMISSTTYAMTVTNISTDAAQLFLACVE